MNRADFYWSIDAALPHVGRTRGHTVGVESRAGKLFTYASDGYTAAVARIDGPGGWCLHLSRGEATDLMRFVRPTLKAHYEEVLSHRVTDTELHVGIADDSAVFELAEPSGVTLDFLLTAARTYAARDLDVREIVLQPSLLAKYGKAQRGDSDRVRVYPVESFSSSRHGIALVTVGTDFLGLVAGMSRDDEGSSTLASFLQNAELREGAA